MLINKRLFHFSLLKKEQNDFKCRKQTSQGRTFFEKADIKRIKIKHRGVPLSGVVGRIQAAL